MSPSPSAHQPGPEEGLGKGPLPQGPQVFSGHPVILSEKPRGLASAGGKAGVAGAGGGGGGGQVPGTAVCVCSGPETQAPLEKFRGLGVEGGAGELLGGGEQHFHSHCGRWPSAGESGAIDGTEAQAWGGGQTSAPN